MLAVLFLCAVFAVYPKPFVQFAQWSIDAVFRSLEQSFGTETGSPVPRPAKPYQPYQPPQDSTPGR